MVTQEQMVEGLHRGHGYGDQNEFCNRVLDFPVYFDLLLTYMFIKKENRLLKFKIGFISSQNRFFPD